MIPVHAAYIVLKGALEAAKAVHSLFSGTNQADTRELDKIKLQRNASTLDLIKVAMKTYEKADPKVKQQLIEAILRIAEVKPEHKEHAAEKWAEFHNQNPLARERYNKDSLFCQVKAHRELAAAIVGSAEKGQDYVQELDKKMAGTNAMTPTGPQPSVGG